ncbi:MAG: alpha/beta hydrolase [Chloroflexota bacterium]
MNIPNTSFAHVNGAQLYYETAGEGHPLVLLHAGIADSGMWDGHFERYSEHYRVIRYDLRGFGQSKIPSGSYSGYQDLASLLDHLEIEKAHVLGISNGGRVAIDFAIAFPKRVDKLVLSAPSVGGYPPSDIIRQFWQDEDEALQRGDLEAATEINLRLWVDGPKRSPDEVDAKVRQKVYQMQMQAFQIDEPEDAEEVGLSPEAIGRLDEITAETLVLVGDLDLEEKIELAKKAVQEINNSQLKVISGAAHMLNMEKPGKFDRAVLAFLLN